MRCFGKKSGVEKQDVVLLDLTLFFSLEIDKVVLQPESDSTMPTGEGATESDRDGESGRGTGGSGGGTGGSGSGIFVQAANGIVSMEAEQAVTVDLDATHKWVDVNDSQASGATALKAEGSGWNSLRSGASMAWTISGTQAGTYDVWVRGKASANGYSVWMDWDGAKGYNRYWYGNEYDQWIWQNLPNQTVTVVAGGQHELKFWARDGDIQIDKVVLLPTGSAAPTGTGPTTSAQQ